MVFSSIKVLLLLAYLSHTVHGEERAARSETHRLGAPDNHSQGLSNVVPDNNEFGSISDRLHRFTAAGGVQWHDAMIEALEAINLEMSLSMTVSDVELLGRPSLHKDDDDQTVLSDYPSTIPVVLSDFHSTNHEKYSDYPSTNPGELSDYPSSIPMVLSDLPSSFGGPLHNDDDDNQRVLSDYPSTIPGMFSDAPSFGVPSLHDDDDADQTVLSDDPSTIQVVLIDYPSASPAELSDSPSTIPAGVVSDYPSIIPVDDATGVILSTTTYAPTPLATSAAPTSVCEVTGEPRALRILAMLDQIADSDSVRDTNTPQGKATAWLIDEDALQVCPDSTTCQLVQRWVLAVIYFATNGDSWFNCSAIGTDDCGNVAPFDRGESRFLSVSSECEWAGISCIDSCVTKIEFEENNLVGKSIEYLCERVRNNKFSLPNQVFSSFHNRHYSDGDWSLVPTRRLGHGTRRLVGHHSH